MELVVIRGGKNAINSKQFSLGHFITLRNSSFVDLVKLLFFPSNKVSETGPVSAVRQRALALVT